ncbi:MAG TPA: TonB-dependent receptor [Candidimonas sp.]|nr:TonB-dependent receptor [Candidimonas sp.]
MQQNKVLSRIVWLVFLCTGTPPILAQQAPQRLTPITVTSTRLDTSVLDTPASISVIDGFDMRDARLQINLSEGLAGVPGLQIQNRQNYAQDLQVSIRGFGSRSSFGVRGVRLYVDGIPATMPDGQGQTSNIDIASIDRVEVLRGPFSSLYGNSSGGVINVYTEDGADPPELSAGLAAGSYGTYRYGAKASGVLDMESAELDYVLSATRFTTQGYRDHSGARKNLVNAKLRLQFDDSSRLTLIANSVDLKADDPLGLTRDQFDSDPRGVYEAALEYNTRKTVKQSQGGLVYERKISAHNDLRAMLYYGKRDTVQFQSIPYGAQANPRHAGGVIDLQREYSGADVRWSSRLALAGKPFTLIGGLSYDEMKEDRRGYENFSGEPIAGRTGQLGVRGDLRRNERNTIWNLDPYLQASWQFLPRWTVDAGLRYSNIRFRSDDQYVNGPNGDDSGAARYRKLLPVASLRYQVSPDISLYGSIGRGFETPTFNEISYRDFNTSGLNFALRPSINTSVEVGAKANIGKGLLTAALFQTRTKDEIVSAGAAGGRTVFQNAGRTLRTGFELAWRGEIARNWRTEVAYTWLDAKFRDDCATGNCADPGDPEKYLRAGNRIPGVARHALYAAVGWAPPVGWRAGVDARYLSKMYVNDGNTETAPGYVVAGVNAGYVWRHGAWETNAYARLDNIFDRLHAGSAIINENSGRYYEPAPGRNWSAGVTASYAF